MKKVVCFITVGVLFSPCLLLFQIGEFMKPYVPDKLPLQGLDYGRLFSFVGDANAELARYDGLLQGIVNPEVMLSPLSTQEAVLSSKIEGTQATVDEVLEQEAGLLKEGSKAVDIQEIINYCRAMFYAHSYLKNNSISLPFVCEMHEMLMDSVRGESKMPGSFRDTQNWIGTPGRPMERATFVPPAPSRLDKDMSAWQSYMGMDDVDALLQAAVMHAQFELIHPFCDGNGRIGRILIPLFLYQKKKLSQPAFYISAYLEAHRSEYYAKLRGIYEEKDWNSWIEFFFKAVIEQAKRNNKKLTNILALYDEMKKKVSDITHSRYTINIIDAIFDKAIFTGPDFAKRSGINRSTAIGLLATLKEHGMLMELMPVSGNRAAVLCFRKLLEITENGRLG